MTLGNIRKSRGTRLSVVSCSGAPRLGSLKNCPTASSDRITLGLAPIIAVLAMLTATTAAADALHQLQENCEKLAAETFRREPADEHRVAYRTHYNARLNKCFYEETYISPTRVGINMWVYLSDHQENRIYGGFHRSTNIGLFYCNLQHKECHSEAEWNELVKAYMED